MTLSRTHQTIWEKARAYGSGDQAVGLSDEACAYLVARIIFDVGAQEDFPELPPEIPNFFGADDLDTLVLQGQDAAALFERLVNEVPDGDMYFACLASLHKARLKYEAILETQPMPTLEQVGPRSLLQFGKLSPAALAGLLFWRKWFFDIDNRAGQETGYLFEPVIANAIGGIPVPARKSPVKRHSDSSKGRQVDCLLDKRAYEIKIRVTIAASGQGRWREELDYPVDCRTSGYTPVLLILDGTVNPKMTELEAAFLAQGGEVHTGAAAWAHLESLAGQTMSLFIDNYVRGPIGRLIDDAPASPPPFVATMTDDAITLTVGGETLSIVRLGPVVEAGAPDEVPDDVADDILG